ncbi:unknown [Prevotella sp. CAG:1031]|nr:unknown [Prevotella sp. CAG:1031]
MGEMGLAPECVDNECVDPFEPLDCRLRNRTCVGDISQRAYAVAENVELAVENRQRNRLKPRRAE